MSLSSLIRCISAMFTCLRGAFCQYTGVDSTCCWNVASAPTGGDVSAFGLAGHFRLSDDLTREQRQFSNFSNHHRYTHLYVGVYRCAGRWAMLQICRYRAFCPRRDVFAIFAQFLSKVDLFTFFFFRLPGQLWSGASAAVSRCVCWNFSD